MINEFTEFPSRCKGILILTSCIERMYHWARATIQMPIGNDNTGWNLIYYWTIRLYTLINQLYNEKTKAHTTVYVFSILKWSIWMIWLAVTADWGYQSLTCDRNTVNRSTVPAITLNINSEHCLVLLKCDRLRHFEPYGAKNQKFCFPHFHVY